MSQQSESFSLRIRGAGTPPTLFVKNMVTMLNNAFPGVVVELVEFKIGNPQNRQGVDIEISQGHNLASQFLGIVLGEEPVGVVVNPTTCQPEGYGPPAAYDIPEEVAECDSDSPSEEEDENETTGIVITPDPVELSIG